MRTLFRRFIRWITQAERFEVLQSRMDALESQMLLLPLVEDVVEDFEPYNYGALGKVYKITKNHELIRRRDLG